MAVLAFRTCEWKLQRDVNDVKQKLIQFDGYLGICGFTHLIWSRTMEFWCQLSILYKKMRDESDVFNIYTIYHSITIDIPIWTPN